MPQRLVRKTWQAAALADAIVVPAKIPHLLIDQHLAQQALIEAQAERSVDQCLQRMMDALTAKMQRPGGARPTLSRAARTRAAE